MKQEALSVRMRRLRLNLNLSASETAKLIGVSVSTYREWENGRGIRGEPYVKIAKIFGVTLSELLIGEVVLKSKLIQELELVETHLKLLREELFKGI